MTHEKKLLKKVNFDGASWLKKSILKSMKAAGEAII
jgi:hypothetical protein